MTGDHHVFGNDPAGRNDHSRARAQRLRLDDWTGRIDGSCEDCHAEVYDAGTLLIDLVDAQTERLVWRGWAKGSLDGVIDNQAWMEERIDETVARILGKLPQEL